MAPHELATTALSPRPSTPTTTTSPTLYEEHCRPRLGQLLRFLGLDFEYVEASGDRLVTRDGRQVWDFLGGYGVTTLGHNPAAVGGELARLAARRVPIQAQASTRIEAGKLAARLNGLLVESLGLGGGGGGDGGGGSSRKGTSPAPPSPRFFSLFVSTGTEAVEAAIKHALMAWRSRRDELLRRIEIARCALLQEHDGNGDNGFAAVAAAAAAELEESKRRFEEAAPVVLALHGSYHGRTAGSLAVTANESYRAMYGGRSAVEARFLSHDADADDIERALAEHRLDELLLPPSSLASLSLASLFARPRSEEEDARLPAVHRRRRRGRRGRRRRCRRRRRRECRFSSSS